jgi:hypothetical protein
MNPRKCLAKHISVGQSLPIPRSWTKETETPIQNTQAPAELGCRLQGMLETYLSTGFPLLSGDFAGFCSCVRAAGSPSPARLRYQIFRFLGPCCPFAPEVQAFEQGVNITFVVLCSACSCLFRYLVAVLVGCCIEGLLA